MASGTLNFRNDNLITGINVIDGMLYWTDDRNEPRSLDIERWKAAIHSSGTTNIYGRTFENRDITAIRPHPFTPITLGVESRTAIADRPFADIFPRFSYRWRYNDGKYSPFAPFTEAAFISEGPAPTLFTLGFNSTVYSETEAFEAGLNTSMQNGVTSVNLIRIPTGGPDVEEVEILYTESISSTIYAINTITPSSAERTAGVLDTVIINRRNLQGALPANQLLRNFDNVPRLAKAQEITANRLIYANYLQNYDQPNTINMTSEVVASTSVNAGLSVKTNRNYEVGIAFIDEFGRQGGLITNNAATAVAPFFASNTLSIQTTIDATSSPAPTWATHYRYFIKDTSNPHFNLVTTDTYFDTESSVATPAGIDTTYIWAAFNSRDRNKITEDTTLIPKRHTHGNTTGQLFEGQSLHPVIDISNEIPEVLLAQAVPTSVEQGLIDAGNASPTETQIQAGVDALTAVEVAAIRSEAAGRAQGKFFVKMKRETDSNSGGGQFLSTGESSLAIDFGTSVSNTAVRTYRITNLSFTPVAVSYTDATTGSAATITIQYGSLNIMSRTTPTAPGGSSITIFALDTDGTAVITPAVLDVSTLNQIWFETVPIGESQLDLYWETSDTFSIATDYGMTNSLTWSNCWGFRDGDTPDTGLFIESISIEDGFNAPTIGQGVRVNTPQENYEEDRRFSGLIYSGLFNDRTGVNRLNEFIAAEGITKEIEPNYGSIQKLHTRDTNLIVFNESKVFRIQADKDQLFNADGTSNVSASTVVLGQTVPFIGEYGISTNPESFASYGHNIFFSDANKGVILQLTPSNGQFFEMSTQGMSDFFRDRLRTATKIIGGFDDYFNNYIVSVQGYDTNDAAIDSRSAITGDTGNQTVVYDIDTRGWISRVSYIPEGIVTLNNQLYTWEDGQIYLHNANNVPRNNFYGQQYTSEVEVIFNTNPSVVKDYVALSYEGSEGWTAPLVSTDQETSNITGFVNKEGKYFTAIVGTEPIYEFINGSIIDTGLTREKGGMKGFYAPIRLSNNQVTEQDLFSINIKLFNSSN